MVRRTLDERTRLTNGIKTLVAQAKEYKSLVKRAQEKFDGATKKITESIAQGKKIDYYLKEVEDSDVTLQRDEKRMIDSYWDKLGRV
jgi:hypothetical protein